MKYQDMKDQLATGDVLLFEGRSLFAKFIKPWTRSRFSHVAMVLLVKVDGHDRWAVMEALEGQGVHLRPLDFYLKECLRDKIPVHWYKILNAGVDRDKAASFVLNQWGKSYASPWQLLVSFGRITRWIRRVLFRLKETDTDKDRFFCSELVAQALIWAGYNPPQGDPTLAAAMPPENIALFPCLFRQGVIEP